MSAPRMLGEQEPEWEFRAERPLECATAARRSARVAVADGARNISILDGQGGLTGSLRAGQRVRLLRSADDGALFVGLAGQDVVYAFDPEGELQWRIEFKDPVTDLDLIPSVHRLVAVSEEGRVHLHDWQSHQSVVGQLEWPIHSARAVQTEPPVIAVADEEGNLALLDLEAGVRWQKATGGRTGPVRVDPAAGRLLLPALEDGVRTFDLQGAEGDAPGFGGAVKRIEPAPDVSRFMVETASAELVLSTAEPRTLWRKQLPRSPVDWALADEGRLLVLARGGRDLTAHRMPSAAAERSEPKPASAQPRRIERRQDETGAHRASGGDEDHLVWRRPAPEVGGRVRMMLAEHGEYALMAYVSGRAVIYDAAGEKVLEAEVEPPLHLMPPMPRRAFALWGGTQAVLLEPERSARRSLSLQCRALHCNCSRDLRVVCVVDREGTLRCFRDGSPAWQRNLRAFATGLFVSPEGRTILVTDETARYRYYSVDGRLIHKFRFSGEEMHRCYGLTERFSVFSSDKGHVVFVEPEGRRLWTGRPLGALEEVELLDGLVSIYRGSGACAVIDPQADQVWEVWPGSGESRVRKPPHSDPVLFRAEGSTLTVQAGHRAQMRALWEVHCDAPIESFRVDRGATTAFLLAGGELYLVKSKSSD